MRIDSSLQSSLSNDGVWSFYLKENLKMSSESKSSESNKKSGERRRRKMSKHNRRRSSQPGIPQQPPIKNPFADILEDIKEDVVPVDQWRSGPLSPENQSNKSELNFDHKMFVQTVNWGFRAVPVENLSPENGDHGKSLPSGSNEQLTFTIQRIWVTVSTICHGLLGGVSLAHLILICSTSPEEWPLELLKKYAAFAEIFGNTFYFLGIICMVSVLDR